MRHRAWLWAMLCTLPWVGCQTCQTAPPPDRNESLQQAQRLAPGDRHDDQLDCAKIGNTLRGDCVDWYRIDAKRPEGITVALQTGTGRSTKPMALELLDEQGRSLDRFLTGERGDAYVRFLPEAPRYVMVAATDGTKGPWSYQLSVRQDQPPPRPHPHPVHHRRRPPRRRPPPVPKVETHSHVQVLEVERGAQGERVLIRWRPSDGAAVGQRGRLVEGGEKLADIRVIQVFPDGSRAQLLSEPTRPITPKTEAEIDVPVK